MSVIGVVVLLLVTIAGANVTVEPSGAPESVKWMSDAVYGAPLGVRVSEYVAVPPWDIVISGFAKTSEKVSVVGG